MKVTAVKLMQCINVRTKKGVGGLGGEDGEGAEVWVRLKQQKDCWSCFHTSRALVTGKLLCSTLSAVLLTHVCVCVCFWYMCACPQGMKTPVLLFHKARTLFYISAEDKYTYAMHPLFSTGKLTHSTGIGLF